MNYEKLKSNDKRSVLAKHRGEVCIMTGVDWAETAHGRMKLSFEQMIKDSLGGAATEQRRMSSCSWAYESLPLLWAAGQSDGVPQGTPLTWLWVHHRENGLPTAYTVHLISGCQSLLHLSDLLDRIAGGRKYRKVWVIKTLSRNIIKGILKSMTSVWKDIFHTLSSTVGDVAEQKQVKQGVLLMKVLVEKAAGDKMS